MHSLQRERERERERETEREKERDCALTAGSKEAFNTMFLTNKAVYTLCRMPRSMKEAILVTSVCAHAVGRREQ